jgi:hypothetical protein
MSSYAEPLRTLSAAIVMSFTIASVGAAQSAAAAKPGASHPPVCGKGVRLFTEKSQVPVPFDTLRVPPSDGPIRITSPEEAEAAELALRTRAGSVGATGVLVSDVVSDDGGMQRMSRSVIGVFVPADSERAQLACK